MSAIYSPEEDSYLLKEVLEKKIPQLLQKNSHLRFLEVGVGSGIQLETALRLGIKPENIFGVDINPEAVNYCRKLGFYCIDSNLFSRIKNKFNLIIFNPPYLPTEKGEPEDSKLITTGGKTGSEVINQFLIQAKEYLSKDGKILLLVSSLTKNINWSGYKKKLLLKKKIFFEELRVYELVSTR
jgi:release factor glutamine methyltransferase